MDPGGVAAWRRTGYPLRKRQLFRQPIRFTSIGDAKLLWRGAKHRLWRYAGLQFRHRNPYIKNYALQNSFGLVPSISNFTVTQTLPPGGPCPTNVGYVVTASAPYNLINYIFSVTLTAKSCFPINISS